MSKYSEFPDINASSLWEEIQPALRVFDDIWPTMGNRKVDAHECRKWFVMGYVSTKDIIEKLEKRIGELEAQINK